MSDRNNAPEKGNSPMIKIASFIVDKRMLFFLLYILAIIFSLFASNWVVVNNTLSDYLSEKTETRQGVDLMDQEFITFGSAKIMVANISFEDAVALEPQIAAMDGVQQVAFTEEETKQEDFIKHYNEGSAMYSVTFDYSEKDERALEALRGVQDALSEYDIYTETTMGNQQSEIITQEINKIMILVAVVVVSVLLFTSQSTGEIPVLLMTFVASMLLNAGTNFLFGTISFVSNSVSSILQLALSVDYAIIFVNRFKEEKGNGYDTRDAAIVALSKAIPEILSSSMTTICGLFAMVFMQYKIGADLGKVLIKAILLSLLSVFTLMPGLLVLFSNRMEKTQHKNLVPKITFVGKFEYKMRYIIPALFALVFVGATILQNHCPYVYGYNLLPTPITNQYQDADKLIEDTFGSENLEAVVIPHGDYRTEKKLIDDLEARPDVDYCQGLANSEAMDGYMLTDELNPRQFSELLDLDYEVAELLYTTYAADKEDYGRIVGGITSYKVPLMDILMFVHDKADEGYVTLDSSTQETLDDAYVKISNGRKQLEGENYDRILCYLSVPLPQANEGTFDTIQEIHDMAQNYYEGQNVYVVGNGTSERDLRDSFKVDNIVVSIVSMLFVLVILLFTFKSAGLPVLQILVIEGAVFMNFAYPALVNQKLFFMSELIVSSIQMGANIDYAIVISSRYQETRERMGRKDSIIEAVNFAFPTILTSSSMMIFSGVFIGQMTSDACIASIGQCLARGTSISVFLVLFVLPALLVFGDTIIQKTAFDISRPVRMREETGTVVVNGSIRGTINGTVIGTMNAVVRGDVKAIVVSGNMEKMDDDPSGDGSAKAIEGPVAFEEDAEERPATEEEKPVFSQKEGKPQETGKVDPKRSQGKDPDEDDDIDFEDLNDAHAEEEEDIDE